MYKSLFSFFISMVLCGFVAFGAVKDGNKRTQNEVYADKYFAVEDYFLAAEYYNKELEKHPTNAYSAFQLAECYRFIFDYENAEKWYERASQYDEAGYPLATFYHALMMKVNGNYLKASEEFEFFIAMYEPQEEGDIIPSLATMHYNGCLLALSAFKKPIRDFGFHNPGSPLNTEYSDFAPAIFRHDTSLVIASSRIDEKHEEIYGRFGEAFLDNFRFEKNDSIWVAISSDSLLDEFDKINTKYNDGAGTFTSDKNKYYFTRCDEKIADDRGLNCAIYYTKKGVGGVWGEAKKLNTNINPAGEWNAQPSVTNSGDTLFFVSKRPGGYGQHDLYFSVLQDEESEDWGEAVNLGTKINTPYIEISPSYYEAEKVLFFASTGHEGFGGMDIYIAKGAKLDTIRNVGLPFNSNHDDFSMVLGDSVGYLTSNRFGGLGNDDIYRFNIRSRESLIASITKDSLPTEGTITIRGTITDELGNPAPEVVVLLTDTIGTVLKMTVTDELGVFVFANLDVGKDYRVVLDEDDALLTTEVMYNVDDIEVFANEEAINTQSLAIAEAGKPSRVLFENIYYDFNSYELRTEAINILTELVTYAKAHKNLKIEISAHTDGLGTAEYNKALSKKRGDRAYDFLVANGVSRSGIIVNAIGESDPVATNNNEVGRQLNRRVEFHVVGGGAYEAKAMVYVAEPATTLTEIANRFGMTVGEIKELNALDSDEVDEFTPLRVRRSDDADIIAPISLSKQGKDEKAALLDESVAAKKREEEFNDPEKMVVDSETMSTGHEVVYLANSGWNAGVKYYKYDGSGYYTVLPKNTLFSIARVCGVSVDEIKRLNGLKGNEIYSGQRLRVREDAVETVGENAKPSLADAGIAVSDQKGQVVEVDGQKRYVVKEGDTFSSIAKEFGFSKEDLKELNDLESYDVRPGQALLIE